jgi:phosphatidylglycerol:prolipoprotein diacylglycerol transferase
MAWKVDPVAFVLGGWPIHWYSIFFALGLLVVFLYMQRAFRTQGWDDAFIRFLPYGFLGPILGGRVVHFLFYQPVLLAQNPWVLLDPIHDPGLASHGAVLGLLVAGLLFSKRENIDSWWLADQMCIGFMLIGGIIRIGNFFRSELIGKASALPWCVRFQNVDDVCRHPVQLYEAITYLALWVLLSRFGRTLAGSRTGNLTGLTIATVAVLRLWIESMKEGDLVTIVGVTMNTSQWLTLPFILGGLAIALVRCPPARQGADT